jgi:hypothetical protein
MRTTLRNQVSISLPFFRSKVLLNKDVSIMLASERRPNHVAQDLSGETMKQCVVSWIVLVGFISCGFVTNYAQGDLVMTLQGTANSSIVTFTLSGSDIASGTFALLGIGFDITDGYDPFPPGVNGSDSGRFTIQNGSATVTNGTSTLDIGSLFFQDSTLFDTVDRFGAGTLGFFSVTTDDTLTWEGTGTVDLSDKGLIFGDLNPGMGVGVMNFPGLGAVLDGKLVIVPEPSSLVVLPLLGLVCSSAFRRRRSGAKLRQN